MSARFQPLYALFQIYRVTFITYTFWGHRGPSREFPLSSNGGVGGGFGGVGGFVGVGFCFGGGGGGVVFGLGVWAVTALSGEHRHDSLVFCFSTLRCIVRISWSMFPYPPPASCGGLDFFFFVQPTSLRLFIPFRCTSVLVKLLTSMCPRPGCDST